MLPVHAQPDLTAACVKAIAGTVTRPYELIIVDDTADEPTRQVVACIQGATVLRNERNLGYTASLNRGARAARGRFLVFLNDDTEPQEGWLDAMLACAEARPEAGVIVPMYLDPAGFLKEAGSIVWSDGTAYNFGDCDPNPARSRYRYRREVDYGSGACSMVRAEVFEEVGGLDEQFWPTYYEDVDLCFAVREAGHRVVYEPRARVIHVEGATSGTDMTRGTKRYQVVNHELFVRKWGHRLADQPAPGTDLRLASRHRGGPAVLLVVGRVSGDMSVGGIADVTASASGLEESGCAVTILAVDGPADPMTVDELEKRGVEVMDEPVSALEELQVLGRHLALVVLAGVVTALRWRELRALAPTAQFVFDARVADTHDVWHGGAADPAPGPFEAAAAAAADLTLVRDEGARQVLLDLDDAVEVVAAGDALVSEIPVVLDALSVRLGANRAGG